MTPKPGNEPDRRKPKPSISAYVICPFCNRQITAGAIPQAIHRRNCPNRPR